MKKELSVLQKDGPALSNEGWDPSMKAWILLQSLRGLLCHPLSLRGMWLSVCIRGCYNKMKLVTIPSVSVTYKNAETLRHSSGVMETWSRATKAWDTGKTLSVLQKQCTFHHKILLRQGTKPIPVTKIQTNNKLICRDREYT